tara:strand:+ start:2507 stop:3181 length:675 start_codon:yes stop_codon:yes gene_type:complete
MIITKRQLNKIIKINLQNEGVRDKLAGLNNSMNSMIQSHLAGLSNEAKKEIQDRLEASGTTPELAKDFVSGNIDTRGISKEDLAMLMSSTKTMSNDEEQLDLDDEDYYEESEEAELQKLISDVEAECSAGNDPACEELETLYDDLEKIKSEIATNIETIFSDDSWKTSFVVAGDKNPENNGTWERIHKSECRITTSGAGEGPAGYCKAFQDSNISPGPIYQKIR